MLDGSGKPVEGASASDSHVCKLGELLPWDEAPENYLSELDMSISGTPRQQATEAEQFRDDVLKAISAGIEHSSTDLMCTSPSLSPIEQFRPLISTQHKLVSGVLLRQLLRQYELHKQLMLQRSFQLLGDGSFTSRLSRALFDKDVQSAERKRGVIPTGDDLGLRVGATKDQRWPPASSELQLSLMGILAEASNTSSTPTSLLSFAIRELPEEEIEQVLDPHSIHALDFLKIQYTAEPPLDSVITTTSLNQYDMIFRFLLKVLRLLHVTAELPRTAPSSRCEPTRPETLSFSHQAREFVVVLADHVVSIGITPPWQAFIATLMLLDRDLQLEDERAEFAKKAAIDIEGLRSLHETCLDRIRNRLFLKKKQQKLYRGMEDVLSSILKCATDLQTENTDGVSKADHEQFQRKLVHLLNTLSETVEKPAKTTSAADAEDADMTRVLLAKLDWNGYHTGSYSARRV
ncbi:Spindle pole body component [Cercospora zeina]